MWVLLYAFGVMGLALSSLIGWWADLPLLSSLGDQFIPMAPSTAICFLVASTTLICTRVEILKSLKSILGLLLGVCTIYCIHRLYEVSLGLSNTWEDAFFTETLYMRGFRVGQMSPVTAVVFSGISIVLLSRLFSIQGKISVVLGQFVATFSAVLSFSLLVGYFYRAPLLYGGTTIPVAFPTAFCLFLLSVGELFAVDEDVFPRNHFVGNTAKARLLRSLVPSLIVIVFVKGLVVHYLPTFAGNNRILVYALSDLFLLLVMGGVITALAVTLGKSLDGATVEKDMAEAALKKSNLELESKVIKRTLDLARSNEALEQFAHVASHDLQEPLRKIRAFGDLLKKRSGSILDAESLDYLSRMQNASVRMSQLIEGLLKFSRVSTKGQPFESTDLNKVIQEVLTDLEFKTQQSGAIFNVGSLPSIDADPMQIAQLFQNLIGNALKFQKTNVQSIINIHADQSPYSIVISIEDNGIGFEPKYADRIFEIFERLHGRSQYEGTGIGLAICKKIVERHHGKIWAESRPDVGTTFRIELPRQQLRVLPQAA